MNGDENQINREDVNTFGPPSNACIAFFPKFGEEVSAEGKDLQERNCHC